MESEPDNGEPRLNTNELYKPTVKASHMHTRIFQNVEKALEVVFEK